MYPTTMNYRSILDEGNISAWWYGTVTLKDGTTKTFDMSDISDSSGSLNLKCSENSEIGIGTAYAAEFCVQFKNSLGISRYKLFDGIIDLHARITQRINIATWADAAAFTWQELSTAKWGSLDEFSIDFEFPMGVFIIQEVMQSAGDAKIRAYDFMLKAGEELPAAMSTQKKIPYDWLALACTSCGITLGITRAETLRMPNGNRLLAFSNANNNVKTWRDVIAQAAAVLGANAMMDRSGQLTLRRYGKYAADGVSSGFRYSSDFSDYQSYYTGIYLSYKEDGIQDYQTNAASTAQDTGLAYDLGYNAFLQISDEDARHRAMKEIINGQKGLVYVPFKVSMPFNPAYDLMDVVEFYDNQADENDIAPITAITFRIGGKMDISCGGENPALQEALSKEAKALETASSAGLNDFWIVIDNAPEENTVTIQADTPTKIGEALFYAKEALSMFEVNYTATYVLEKTTLIELEVKVDNVTVYKTQENQWPEENRITVTTGCTTDTAGSHSVSIWITIKESTLDVGGGGVLRDLSITQNSIYQPEDFGVYGFRNVTAAVPDDYGYYGGVQQLNVGSADVASSYEDEQSYQGSITHMQNPDLSTFCCRISENIGDGASFDGRYFTRTSATPPLLFINYKGSNGYNGYAAISNHSDIPEQSYNSYGDLVYRGTLTVDGNTFYVFGMNGMWSSSTDGILYTVGGASVRFQGSIGYIYFDFNTHTGSIAALNSDVEADIKATLADFATMG